MVEPRLAAALLWHIRSLTSNPALSAVMVILLASLGFSTRPNWNADAAALSNPTVAFAPYPKDAQVSVAESDAFRGCTYSTVGVSITDALTGGDVTEQKPHCDWEGFDDGKYKNAWNGCDWGSCDEWE